MKIKKSIAYCYPTSTRSKELNCWKTGGYYVQQQQLLDTGYWSKPYVAIGCGDETFQSKDHPDLISLFNNADGEPA